MGNVAKQFLKTVKVLLVTKANSRGSPEQSQSQQYFAREGAVCTEKKEHMEKRFRVEGQGQGHLTLREGNRVVIKLWVLSQDKLFYSMLDLLYSNLILPPPPPLE